MQTIEELQSHSLLTEPVRRHHPYNLSLPIKFPFKGHNPRKKYKFLPLDLGQLFIIEVIRHEHQGIHLKAQC